MCKFITSTILFILFTTVLNANKTEVDSSEKAYVPSYLQIQYAGNIGMISMSPSWGFFKNRLNMGLSFGYVPKFSAKKPIYMTSLKAAYSPRLSYKVKNFRIKPVSLGLMSSYTFGNRFNKYLNQNKYPEEYYWWNPAFRFGLFLQSEVSLKINSRVIKGSGLYFEISCWDLNFYNYTGNSNDKYLSAWELVTLGFGGRVFFK